MLSLKVLPLYNLALIDIQNKFIELRSASIFGCDNLYSGLTWLDRVSERLRRMLSGEVGGEEASKGLFKGDKAEVKG